MASVRRIVVGGQLRAWRRAGFAVTDGRVHLDGVTLTVDAAAPRPIAAWGLEGADGAVDGLAAVAPGEPSAAELQPNGVTALDHVVALTRDLDVTEAAFARHGLQPRRHRDVPGSDPAQRQLFYVLDTTVCELVGPVAGNGEAGTARLWGLAFVAPDLDDTVAALGLLCGPIRDAVQPGRRIATLRHRAAGLPVPIVLMSPRLDR